VDGGSVTPGRFLMESIMSFSNPFQRLTAGYVVRRTDDSECHKNLFERSIGI
jgi:hypothetical protein